MVDFCTTVLIIMLNANGPRTPIKKHKLSDWMKKQAQLDDKKCTLIQRHR